MPPLGGRDSRDKLLGEYEWEHWPIELQARPTNPTSMLPSPGNDAEASRSDGACVTSCQAKFGCNHADVDAPVTGSDAFAAADDKLRN